ncbi:MAG: polyprenyl synthetase family protein [Chlamydiae bacterium]|nr:polyprenyl synthetase family protein [Chlamydiota bacterium]
MPFSSYMSTRCEMIEETLNKLSTERLGVPHSTLFSAARYSLLAKAKRLRPLLTLAVTESFGGNIEAALHPACALELIHTYSLIHDDLPCMDDDDLRRGVATLHKVYGEGHAVLTGDYLLTLAFEVLAKSPLLTAEQKLDLITILSQRAGGDGMVGGQVVDMLSEGKEVDFETLTFIHSHKTGALISAALEFGGIIANASKEDRALLKKIGYEIGLSFQIIDDILDVKGNEKEIGKPIHSDQDNNKSTSITLLGIENAEALADKLLSSSKGHCKMLSTSSPYIEEILQKLIHRKF